MKKLFGLLFIVAGLLTCCGGLASGPSVITAFIGVGVTVLGLVAVWEAERGKK